MTRVLTREQVQATRGHATPYPIWHEVAALADSHEALREVVEAARRITQVPLLYDGDCDICGRQYEALLAALAKLREAP